jgi:hypothetical protein
VIETHFDRLIYLSLANILGDLPRSKPDLRDMTTVVELDTVKRHYMREMYDSQS